MATAVSSELEAARHLARAALTALERSRRRIDDLNVYPVPDGDTGTNMTETARAVVDGLMESAASNRAELAREITRSALMGARGNSGVILSQIIRGFADGLGEAEPVDGPTLARAFRSSSDAAYRAVRQPVEGTMLTAIRALAEAAEENTAMPAPELLGVLVRAGDAVVARTREQLDVLREAGVVDAGAAGLIELVRGLAAGLSGEELPDAPLEEEEAIAPEAIHQELSRYRYCTTFVVEGEELDAERLEQELEALGDSLLVVGDPSALKVHVHTDDPGAALGAATQVGVIEGVEIANMHRQTEQREERLLEAVADAVSDVVAVVAGAGNRLLFENLGAAHVVEGGQSMNPSAADLVAAIETTRASGVVVLPNNPNVVMAAEQAAELSGKDVHVLPTESIPAGLAALVAYDPSRSAEDNAAEMKAALESVATGAVTVASREAEIDGIVVKEGSYFGLVGRRAVAAGPDFLDVARTVVDELLSEPRDVLMLLTGKDAPPIDVLIESLGARHSELEIEVHDGGQLHYPLLLSAE
jgi:DAK2 domain fusion protein YloV